jgi:hypothetical protein
MATYVNDLRLKEITTGDESGTWGTSTNTNLELIAEAFSYGTEASFSSDADATTTIADGLTDPARSLYFKVTSGVSLTATRTLTIAPNDVSKIWIIENATSGSQSINISQGSGANITIPAGDTKVVYSDGAGAGAAFFDAFASLSVVDLKVQDDLTVTDAALVTGVLTTTATQVATGGITSGSDIISDTDSTDSLGSTGVRWLKGWFDTLTAGTLTVGSGSVTDSSGAISFGDENLTTTGIVTAAGTSVFTNLDISGDIDVDGTTNLDVVDIDGALTQDGGAVFNEAGADVDFRVESDTVDHALFVQGSDGNVGIGTSSPDSPLEIDGGSTVNTVLHLTSGTENTYLKLSDSNTTNGGFIGYATEDMFLLTDNTERLRIDSSGKVGIGTAEGTAYAPAAQLEVAQAFGGNSGTAKVRITSKTAGAFTGSSQLDFAYNDYGNVGVPNIISSINATPNVVSPTNVGGILIFSTKANGTATAAAPTERLRIDNLGNVGIGTTTNSTVRVIIRGTSTSGSNFSLIAEDSAGTDLLGIRDDGAFFTGAGANSPVNLTIGTAANLVVNTDGYLYKSTSSRRYKNTITDATHGLTELLTLRPVTYKGNSDADGDTVYGGLIAEEVHDAGLTEFVVYNEENEPDALAYSNMVSLCVKAIQEQQALIESLTTRLETLENA